MRVVGLIALVAALLAPAGDELRAFERPQRPSDRLALDWPDDIVDSRRVARYTDSRGRVYTLFVAKTAGGELCVLHVDGRGAGGGCSPAEVFLNRRRPIAATSGRLFAGVVANEVERVVIVGSLGRRHPVALTRDGGFIHNCRAYNGCAGLIACVEAYGRDDKLLARQAWSPPGCPRSKS